MFKKAERKQARLKIGISGPSGSGKTFSALRLARGMGGKVAFIDTENGSASLYSDRFDFDVLELEPPHTIARYTEAINLAAKSGYDVLVVDSASHAWSDLLDRKTKQDARGGNSFTNWAKFTPEHNAFLKTILQCPMHLICTVRSKQDYVMAENNKGKVAPQKVGLAPVQREGFEYEFTTMFDVAMDHNAATSKDRTGLFTDKIFQITEGTGEMLADWLNGGVSLYEDAIDLLKSPTLTEHESWKTMAEFVEKNRLNDAALSAGIDKMKTIIQGVN